MSGGLEGTLFARADVDDRLARVLGHGADADAIEASFSGDELDYLRLAESQVVQASSVIEGRVAVRAFVGGAVGIAVTTDLSDGGLDACTRRAIAQARADAAGPIAEALSAPSPGDALTPLTRAVDAETARLDAEVKTRWLAPVLAAHERDDLALAGRFHSGLLTRAVRSTTGVAAYHQGSMADLSLSALERPAGHRASSFRARLDRRVREADVLGLADTVRAEIALAREPKRVELGAWDVVLLPSAVAELLMWLGDISFGSRAVRDGMSFVPERLGQRVTSEQITLVDDGRMDGLDLGVPSPFDAEGQARRRVELIARGRAAGTVHDSRSARTAGCHSTGHAQHPADLFGDGSKPNHLQLRAGDADLDALVGRLDRGLLITRFHYVNGLLEPRRAVMTGLLRDAAFYVEDGRVRHAVEPMRFTDAILEAFDRVPDGAIGHALESHSGWSTDACYVCPPILIRGLRFTSGR